MKISMQNYDPKKMSKVVGRNLPVSSKVAYEVAKHIRGLTLTRAIRELEEVQKIKRAIPYTRFNKDTPHRKGAMSAGRYPEKAARYVIPLLKSLKTNADDKGIEGELEIVHSAAKKPSIRRRYGRVKGKKRLTHFELVAMPTENKK